MGASTAWWLARRGRSVVLLERFAQGHRNGSSHGTERIFRLTSADALYCRCAAESLPLWRELEEDAVESLFLTTGHIDFDTEQQLQIRADAAAAAGVATTWLQPGDVAERWPGMHTDLPVLFHPGGGRTNAQATIDAMLRRARALGADVRFETPVTAVRTTSAGAEVDTVEGTLRAAAVVVATAGWTPELLAGQVPGLPAVESSTGQVAFFRPNDSSASWPTWVSPETYGMPTPDGRVRVGHFQHSRPVHPDRRGFDTDPHTRAEIEGWVAEYVPGVDPHNVGELSCLFGETLDDDFVIDRSDNIVVGCGFGGTGFKFAPLVGRMLADLATGAPGPGGRFALGRP
ncbi:MAG: Monomeric sarcosine oxidase [Acidimicrobiales bacterium]|nr:Monomeric sarcosine oxidase [Acidimicrobiales bacterium]